MNNKWSELGWTCLDSIRSAQLLTRLNASLAWATTTVSLARLDAPLWYPEDTDIMVRPIDKMILEASLLALIAGRCEDARTAAKDLMQEVAKHTEVASRLYELIRRRPHLRTSIGLLWVALDSFDCGDADQRISMRELWKSEPFPAQPHERSPYRLLDQAWVRSKAKGEIDPVIATGALVPFTSLGNLDGAPFMPRNDLYALTHTAMYITDFGEWSQPDTYSSEVIGGITLSRLMEGDFDLAAELALADVLVGDQACNGTQVAVRAVLNDVFDAIGRIPSPSFEQSDYDCAVDQDTYLRFHSYHTTFVYALLCYGILRDQNRQSLKWEPALSTFEERYWHPSEMTSISNPISNLSALVAKHTQEWTAACIARGVPFNEDETDLLRSVLDGHLVHAVQNDQVDDILQLLSMSGIAGQSQIDRLVRKHISQRARLARSCKNDKVLAEKVATDFERSALVPQLQSAQVS